MHLPCSPKSLIVGLIRCLDIRVFLERTFKRLVMLGEGAVSEAGPEQGAHAGLPS